jgi:hypothetical protein
VGPRSSRPRRAAFERRGLALLATLVLVSGGAWGAERPFPTLIALGWAQPIATSEGLPTPIVVADHESGGHYGEGRLSASLRTSEANLGMTHPVAAWLDLGYSARIRATTEGDGRDLYRDGDRDSGSAFLGDSLAAMVAARLLPRRPWRPRLELERMEARFRRDPSTRADFELPPNFAQTETRLALQRAGLLGEEDAEATLTLVLGKRERWTDWSLELRAVESAAYRKAIFHVAQPLTWSDRLRSGLEGWLLGGDDLDLFSGYAVGGLTGRYPVGGYFRNEFRARQAAVLNLSHELRLAEERRFSLHLDGARLETIGISPREGSTEWRSIASVGLGLYYGIRGLGGLPVIVRYAEGLLIPEGSKERQRREILLVLAAGF